ncbi:MAG TPA: DUF3108 domain-containing protein, partial [Pyrinomonadaceae bacterium]
MFSSDFRWFSRLVRGALIVASASSAGAQGWESTLGPQAPGPFPLLRPVRAIYGFGWNGVTAATAEIHLSNAAEDRLQLDVTGHTIGFARSLWNFDCTHFSTTNAHTLRPIEVRETEALRSKKVETELSFTPQGVTSKR